MEVFVTVPLNIAVLHVSTPSKQTSDDFPVNGNSHSNRTPLVTHQNVGNESNSVCYTRLAGAPVGRWIILSSPLAIEDVVSKHLPVL